MLQGPRYRPAIRRQVKPEPGPVVAVALLLVALVITTVIFLVHKPGFVAPARPLDPGHSPLAIPSPSSKPLPSATPIAVNPANPATYLELLNVNPEKLPPEQAKIANALNQAASGVSKVPEDYLALIQRFSQDVLQPLNTAKTPPELDNIQTAGQRLRDEVKRARDSYAATATTLTGDLTKAGLAGDLAGQVAARFVERAQLTREPVFSGAESVSQDAIACADVLKTNIKKWHRDPSGKLVFRSKAVRAAYRKNLSQLKSDVDKLNQALSQNPKAMNTNEHQSPLTLF